MKNALGTTAPGSVAQIIMKEKDKKARNMGPTCNNRQFVRTNSLPSCCTQTHFLNIWIWICAWVKIILIVIMKTMIMMAVMMKMTLTLFSADHKLGGDCWLVLQTRGSLGLGRWPLVVLLIRQLKIIIKIYHKWPLVVLLIMLSHK